MDGWVGAGRASSLLGALPAQRAVGGLQVQPVAGQPATGAAGAAALATLCLQLRCSLLIALVGVPRGLSPESLSPVAVKAQDSP